MNVIFAETTQSIPALFEKLAASRFFTEKGIAAQKGRSGVYVFFEEGRAVHVGRTRNLAQRLRAHITRSHHSASFAFKRARRELGLSATYMAKGSRGELAKDPIFAAAFHRHIELLRNMGVRFVEVPDPLQQYLLELYAHLEYGLQLDEFNTH